MTLPPTITVVICTRSDQRWAFCAEAIRSIQAQTRAALELVLVVDHNPALLAAARTEFPHIRAIENIERQGLSGARNSGLRAARGDVVAFLDDDAAAEPDWLARIVARYTSEQVLGVGGRVEPEWLAPRPDWLPEEFFWVVGCSWRGTPTRLSPVRNLIGANMSFRRSLFEQVGGFRSGIGRVDFVPLGCEETEFCIRAGQAHPGGVFLYDPDVRVRHKVTPERVRWAYFRSRCHAEGVSKALVSYFVGSQRGLSAETRHALWTLPTGVLRALADSLRHANPGGVRRAGAIVAGLAITTSGFLAGKRTNFAATLADSSSASATRTTA